ncbi:hypothetical protein B6J61_19990 [Klebsiella pneumoniae]|nr:hypothetical protein B6J61_19990 [Klebsiella pneumoniae]
MHPLFRFNINITQCSQCNDAGINQRVINFVIGNKANAGDHDFAQNIINPAIGFNPVNNGVTYTVKTVCQVGQVSFQPCECNVIAVRQVRFPARAAWCDKYRKTIIGRENIIGVVMQLDIEQHPVGVAFFEDD